MCQAGRSRRVMSPGRRVVAMSGHPGAVRPAVRSGGRARPGPATCGPASQRRGRLARGAHPVETGCRRGCSVLRFRPSMIRDPDRLPTDSATTSTTPAGRDSPRTAGPTTVNPSVPARPCHRSGTDSPDRDPGSSGTTRAGPAGWIELRRSPTSTVGLDLAFRVLAHEQKVSGIRGPGRGGTRVNGGGRCGRSSFCSPRCWRTC